MILKRDMGYLYLRRVLSFRGCAELRIPDRDLNVDRSLSRFELYRLNRTVFLRHIVYEFDIEKYGVVVCVFFALRNIRVESFKICVVIRVAFRRYGGNRESRVIGNCGCISESRRNYISGCCCCIYFLGRLAELLLQSFGCRCCAYERGDKSGVLEHGDICPSESFSLMEFFAFIHPALEDIAFIGHRFDILKVGDLRYGLVNALFKHSLFAVLRNISYLAAFSGRKCDMVTFLKFFDFLFLGFFRFFSFFCFRFAGDSVEHYGVFHPVVPQLKLCSSESAQSLYDIIPVLVLRHGKEPGRAGYHLRRCTREVVVIANILKEDFFICLKPVGEKILKLQSPVSEPVGLGRYRVAFKLFSGKQNVRSLVGI